MKLGVVLCPPFLASGTASAQVGLGVAGPIAWPSAAGGEQFKRGAEVTAQTINPADGFAGPEIGAVVVDKGSHPKQAF
jgi:branched-chain amino acid transport system substrate-binding protein